MSERGNAVAGLFIAIGLIVAGLYVSTTLEKARRADNVVTVKGLAEQNVKADLGLWNLTFALPSASLDTLYAEGERNQQTIVDYLIGQGLPPQDISVAAFSVQDALANQYNNNNNQNSRFVLNGEVRVSTHDVDKLEMAERNARLLIKQGVVLTNSMRPTYKYTSLNEIKPRMLELATHNAREAADQFAKDSGAEVGAIKRANQGLFSIYDADATGEYNPNQNMMKTVRVVSTVTYYLE